MTQIKSKVKVISVMVVVLAAILTATVGYAFAYPNISAPAQMTSYSVNIANKAGLGSYLTNGTGWTLYTFARDIPSNATSRCMGVCARNWPAFYTSSLVVPSGLDASSFTAVARADGGKQLAFKGFPLYYFINDTKPGDTNGQGFLNLWSVCTFPTPVPEFGPVAITTISVLFASLAVLRRRRK